MLLFLFSLLNREYFLIIMAASGFLRNIQTRTDFDLHNKMATNISDPITIRLDACNRTFSYDDLVALEHPPTQLIEGICYPLLLCLCTFGNVLNLLVLQKN